MGFSQVTDAVSSRRGKWVTLAVWLLIAAIVIPLAPTLSDITENDQVQFLPDDAESTQAAELARERFPSGGTPAIIVFSSPDGLDEQAFSAVEQISEFVQSNEAGDNISGVVSTATVPEARGELVSPDNTTMTMAISITGPTAEDEYANTVEEIRDYAAQFDSDSLTVRVTGPGGLIVDLVSVFSRIDTFLLLVTVVLVLVLLILIYRSPVVALIPLFSVGLVFSLSGGVAALLLREVGFPVNGQATGIMTVVLFGAGTDYCLFIASRYREELVRNEDKHEAMRRSMRGVGGAIASAGGTILIASGVLLLAWLGSYKSLGPVIAIAVGVMMLAAVTLVPALLTIIGRWSFWPFRPQFAPDQAGTAEEKASGIWSRIANVVLRRPGTVLAGATLLLLAMTLGMFQLDLSYDSLESLPSDTPSVEGYELLRAGFPAGELSPTSIYIELPDDEQALSSENLQQIDAITQRLARMDGVAGISGPSRPFGVEEGPGPEQVLAASEAAGVQGGDAPSTGGMSREQAMAVSGAASQFISEDSEVARLEVILNENPYGSAGMDLIPEIRETSEQAATDAGIEAENVLVGGETAESYDTRVANTRDTLVVLPLVLLSIAIILGVLLRSLVAPLYLTVTIIVSYFATLGLSILVFTFIFGHTEIGSSVPFFLFVFLNALGVDYNIYLMARIQEEADRHDLDAAVERALTRTGGVITSAGLILAGTFSALMTLPLRDLFQLGFAVAIGVLMDTFITRTIIVPSIVKLLGRWNWWPSKRSDAPTTGTSVRSGEQRSVAGE